MKNDEITKVSATYKKAFNHADLICRYMPGRIDKLHSPKNEDPEYTRGFEDRLNEYKREQELTKEFSIKTLHEKYSKDIEKEKQKKQGQILAPKFKR